MIIMVMIFALHGEKTWWNLNVSEIQILGNLCVAAQCSYHITEREGTLTYPSSGGSYLPTQNCQWVIEGAIGSRLQIQVGDLFWQMVLCGMVLYDVLTEIIGSETSRCI